MQRVTFSAQLVLLAGLTMLTGCADWEKHAQSTLPTPRPAYEDKQITVSPTRSWHAVSFAPGKMHISDDEKAYLSDFLNRTVQDGERTVMVEQPGRGADRVARQRAAALSAMLRSSGYHIHPLTGVQPVAGEVNIAVDHLIAQAPNCPNWDMHPNMTFGSEPIPNHGCADRQNLAAMIANPRDLIVGQVPAAPTGHAPMRGEVNYRNGVPAPLQDAGEIVGN